MKIIHCADVHLGSTLRSKYPPEVSEIRRREVRNSFHRLVEYAKENGVGVILLSGDVFDSDKPFKKDTDFFYDVVAKNPDIEFLYLRGNHDSLGERKAYPNLKTFAAEWTQYAYGDVVICGVESVAENATSMYSTLVLDESKKNIVMLHGETSSASGVDKVNLSKLCNKNIDYLALGHIHSYSCDALDERGVWAYSGCLEGRGFDETGEKGFILLDIGEEIKHTFVPFSTRQIFEIPLDVSGLSGAYEMAKKARGEIAFKKEHIYRLELVGEVDGETDAFADDVKKYLDGVCLYLDLKDHTKKKANFAAYAGDNSLKGEFARMVESSEFSDEDKAQILAYGMRALLGREVDA